MNEFEKDTPEIQEIPPEIAENAVEVTDSSTPDFSMFEPVLQEPVPVQGPIPVPAADAEVTAPSRRRDRPEPEKKKKRKKHHVSVGAFVAVCLIFALLLGCCGMGLAALDYYWSEKLDDLTQKHKEDLASLAMTMADFAAKNALTDSTTGTDTLLTPSQIYAQNVDAVVSVSCQVGSGWTSGYSTGSGFIISPDGYVLTNAHVVDKANSISVHTYSGMEVAAKLIGKDALKDVALLKIEGSNLPYVTLGSSANVIVGEQVAAIGNPLGTLAFSMTVGHVSAKDRIVDTEGTTTNMIQADVAINSGNSGGPLFNMAGQVIGITSAKYSGESSSGATIEGISFAIPIDDVQAIIPQLKENGYVSYAYLGVSVRDAIANPQTGSPAGAEVVETFKGYAAEEAGIQPADIIVKVDDHTVTSVSSLTTTLRNFKPGDKVDVVVHRNGSEVTITLTLDERPEE